jgi:hypothetical protein
MFTEGDQGTGGVGGELLIDPRRSVAVGGQRGGELASATDGYVRVMNLVELGLSGDCSKGKSEWNKVAKKVFHFSRSPERLEDAERLSRIEAEPCSVYVLTLSKATTGIVQRLLAHLYRSFIKMP